MTCQDDHLHWIYCCSCGISLFTTVLPTLENFARRSAPCEWSYLSASPKAADRSQAFHMQQQKSYKLRDVQTTWSSPLLQESSFGGLKSLKNDNFFWLSWFHSALFHRHILVMIQSPFHACVLAKTRRVYWVKIYKYIYDLTYQIIVVNNVFFPLFSTS